MPGKTKPSRLAEDFRSPPDTAKPRVWWHWMEGNITSEGIVQDLHWMKRVGIGGVTCIDASLNTPVVLKKPLTYQSDEWWGKFRESAALADQLGLEFGIASSPGWSVTGGPWVKPQQAMKKIVWSETLIKGGGRYRGRLESPPDVSGRFQEVPFGQPGAVRPKFYADIAVLAYRATASERDVTSAEYVVRDHTGLLHKTTTGPLAEPVTLPFPATGEAWLEFTFTTPQQIQGVSLIMGRATGSDLEPGAAVRVETSADGEQFSQVSRLPASRVFHSSALQQTLAFAAQSGRIFRLVFERPPLTFAEQNGLKGPIAHQVAKVVWHGAARVHRFEDKAGFSTRQILPDEDTSAAGDSEAILASELVDLTKRMQPDGSIDWTPPEGDWMVLRFGYSLTGSTNHPTKAAATGLEVDKLNREHVKDYIETYLGEFEKHVGPKLVGKHGIQHLLIDSFEAGPQNWTENMAQQFHLRRGYEIKPWLPVLAGRIVESATDSERFLWDFRSTIGELLAESHYGQINESTKARNMRTYVESHESHRLIIADGMDVKKTADIPMGAMWAVRLPGYTQENYDADIRESASVAHIYGKQFVAGEMFGAFCPGAPAGCQPYIFSPRLLKPVADRAMAMGLNRFVIANSDHQLDDKPGPGLGTSVFGQWFSRKETWAEIAGAWLSYLSRSSYLLQQGRFAASIAYFYGEDTNITSVFNVSEVQIPSGYSFDFVNATVLLNEITIENGQLKTPGGTCYDVLILDPSITRMSLPVLRKLQALVSAGIKIIGACPECSPSFADKQEEFRQIASSIWDKNAAPSSVLNEPNVARALLTLGAMPDVDFNIANPEGLRFVHRILDDGHLYFVSNARGKRYQTEAKFRVTGKRPEIWRADDGTTRPVSYRMENDYTAVTLDLEIDDAIFVVFRENTAVCELELADISLAVDEALNGPWQVEFQPGREAPTQTNFDQLISWKNHPESGIRYFSGTATYRRTWMLPPERFRNGNRVYLDLGELRDLAQVTINNNALGVLWKKPFKLEITDSIKPGENLIEIRITNLWCNRLIGDKQPGEKTLAYAALDPFTAESALLDSGLLGPVTVCWAG